MNSVELRAFNDYSKDVQATLAAGHASEGSYYPPLKALLESLSKGVIATSLPSRIECGAPDFIITKDSTTIGYVEAKDVGRSLDDIEQGKGPDGERFERYLSSLTNVILTNYLEFRWYVDGERRLSAHLGEEVTRGMRESASRGFYVSSYAPYGYRKVKVSDGSRERPKLGIEPYQAQIVRRIFRSVIDGKGLIDISKELNREGIISPRGNSWGKTTIHKILTNEAYIGTLVWGRSSVRNLPPIRVEEAWSAIVDRDTFKHVQSLLKERAFVTTHPKRVASNYLLSGLAKCGYCGKALVGQDAKGGRFHYYVCGTLLKKGAGSCSTPYINSQKFEKLVINRIKEHILTYDNLKELVSLVNEEMDAAASEYQERFKVVSVEIAGVNQRLERLYDALETGSLQLADLAPRIKRLRERQEQLHVAKLELGNLLSDRKVELADPETVKNYVADLYNLLGESTLVERKSFIRSFVKEVRVTGVEALMTYTIPLPPKQLSQETLAVPPIVHYSGQ